jgi:hypothetical protein
VEHSLQPEAKIAPLREGRVPSSADTPMGKLVDDKISDVIRMTVATAGIVLESDGCPDEFVIRMREKVLRMLGVKERRN